MYRIAQTISNWKKPRFLFTRMFSFTMQSFHAVTAGIVVYTKKPLPILSLKITLRRHWFAICILCRSTSWLLIYQSFLPSMSSTDHAQLIHRASETEHPHSQGPHSWARAATLLIHTSKPLFSTENFPRLFLLIKESPSDNVEQKWKFLGCWRQTW